MSNQPFYIKQLELGPMRNFVYLLGDPETREAAVVDPGWEVPQIMEAVAEDGYKLTHVFLSHTHFDHVQGLGDLLNAIDLPVFVHDAESHALEISETNIKPVGEGDIIHVGSVPVTFLHTPGHTQGSQCMLIGDHIFSGDTLFVRACGRWDLPGGDPRALYTSLADKLKKLPDHTRLYPGHNYGHVPISTIGDEKQHNPFLKPATSAEFLRSIGYTQ